MIEPVTEFPVMPDDYWPEMITVIGKNGDVQWSFSVSGEDLRLAKFPLLLDRINALRDALWMQKHLPEETV